jgi:hypothetical protein
MDCGGCACDELTEQALQQLLAVQARVFGDQAQDRMERTDPQGGVIGDGNRVFFAQAGHKAHVAAPLMFHLISQPAERTRQVRSREVAWEFHAAITSS